MPLFIHKLTYFDDMCAYLRNRLSVEEYSEGVKAADRTLLSRAITLSESTLPEDERLASEVLTRILPYAGKSVRIGITGVPGVGKSTFIETFGNYLIDQGHKVAILAIDPSSQKTKGSILGDKTRMETLAKNMGAYIRPSASGSALGGVADKTRESILLCEAAGFDIVIVETVGVGQSETAVHQMVDFFLLLMLAGAGDELQGIKKGIMEMADAVIINKSDGDNKANAERAKRDYQNALHLFPANENGWLPQVKTASATEKSGIKEIWEMISSFVNQMQGNGHFQQRRQTQNVAWMHDAIKRKLLNTLLGDPAIAQKMILVEKEVAQGKLPATLASLQIVEMLQQKKEK